MTEDLTNQFRIQRRQILTLRSKNLLDTTPGVEKDDEDNVVDEESGDDSSSGSDDSDGEFEDTVSDDEEVVKRAGEDSGNGNVAMAPNVNGTADANQNANAAVAANGDKKPDDRKGDTKEAPADTVSGDECEQLYQRETTRSLALRLLDVDVGYSGLLQ